MTEEPIRFGDGQHNDYADRLDDHQDGFVWNPGHARLHKANCQWIQAAEKEDLNLPEKKSASVHTTKWCSPDKNLLLARFGKGRSPDAWCKICEP